MMETLSRNKFLNAHKKRQDDFVMGQHNWTNQQTDHIAQKCKFCRSKMFEQSLAKVLYY